MPPHPSGRSCTCSLGGDGVIHKALNKFSPAFKAKGMKATRNKNGVCVHDIELDYSGYFG